MENIKEILFKIMSSALNASKPDGNFNYIPSKPKGKTIILGAGKASASMAKAFEKIYPHKLEGLVVTRYWHNDKTKFVNVLEASHIWNISQTCLKHVQNMSSNCQDIV